MSANVLKCPDKYELSLVFAFGGEDTTLKMRSQVFGDYF